MTPAGIAVIGIGETAPARRSERDLRDLTVEAVLAAIADAGLQPHEIDGIVSDSLIMPATVSHEWLAGQLGITRTFDAATSYGGAGTVAAPLLARMAIEQKLATNVLCYFGVDWGSLPGGPYAFHDAYPGKLAFEKPYGFNGQPSYFALWAQRYAYEYGLPAEALGGIAVTQRANAIRTGRAQNQRPLSMDDYVSAPLISDPLRYPDCCLISDGAAAFVMTAAARAVDAPRPPVYVKGVGFGSDHLTGDDVFTQKPQMLTLPGVQAAREQVERAAGMSVTEVDFAELYDCFTISCLMQLEDLGLCSRGEGGAFVASGNTRLTGSMPVNTHGGMLSYSYLLGAEHVIEAVRQLRGEAGDNQVTGVEHGLVSGLSVPDYGLLLLGRTA